MKRFNLSALTLMTMCAASGNTLASSDFSYEVQYGKELPQEAMQAAQTMLKNGAVGFSVASGHGSKNNTLITFGDIERSTQLPIASSTKFLTAATVMAVVDDGKLKLDDPISKWLPDVSEHAKDITLRQVLSQTTGIAGSKGELYDLAQDHRITLEQSAIEVTNRPLESKSGTVFAYGAPGFQVAGALVEAVTGKRWSTVFKEKIADPLGMKGTYWYHLRLDTEDQLPPEETLNPVLQGGVVSTVDDYMSFLSMLAQNGSYNGKQVLSKGTVDAMLSDQTPSVKMTPTGANVLADAHYSLGSWCETWDSAGKCDRNSSIGMFGTYPWVERKTGNYGIVFIYKRENAFQYWNEMETIRDAIVK